MAKKKSENKGKSGGSGLSLNKVAFFTICLLAVIYLVTIILSALGIPLLIIGSLQAAATLLLVITAAILAWRFVAKKQAVWKVLYIICLLAVIIGVILPLILSF